ncbi:MAG: ParB/RepB/Spo0J family partition protein [Gammaproteobacteria bacterium]
MKRRGLGKNLNAILSDPILDRSDDVVVSTPDKDGIRKLAVDQLQRGQYQPRREMEPEALKELADSIKAQGLLQPIIVRPVSDKQYEIIAGERRWRAAQLAGLDEVSVIVRDIPDEAAMAIGLIENIQRENLNPIEEAEAFARLLTEFELTHQQIAEKVGRSRVAVSNMLRLLQLDESVRAFLERGDIEMGHARALLALEGGDQLKAAKQVIDKGLSVRQTEQMVRNFQQKSTVSSSSSKRPVDPDVLRLQRNLSDTLGAKVAIHHQASGKGKIAIHYSSVEDLDRLLEFIEG